jgi:phosphoglycolate phosphatase
MSTVQDVLTKRVAEAPIRAILFDKDGTLVDFDRTWGPAVKTVLRQLAGENAVLYRELLNESGINGSGTYFRRDSPIISEPTNVFAARWAPMLGRRADPEFFREVDRLLDDATSAHLMAIGEPKVIMSKLIEEGYRLGLATNDAEATARAHARKLGFEHLLIFIAGYDSGFGAKPNPGPVLAFATAVDVPIKDVVVVGDTPHDVATARAAGCKAVLVRTGPTASDDLERAKPDAIIASIAQLSAWLETQ